jgi:hypothetical protein
MNPNAPQPTLPTPDNPYGFILNPNKNETRKFLPSNSRKTRILIILLASIIVLLLVSMLFSMISRNSSAQVTRLKDLLAEQQEIIRVSAIGLENISTAETRNYLTTINYSAASQQQQLSKYLSGKKVTIEKTLYDSKLDTTTDKQLAAAVQNNKYEQIYDSILLTLLTEYQKDLKEAYKKATTNESKAILTSSFNSVSLLL